MMNKIMAKEQDLAQVRRIFIPLTAGELIWGYVERVRQYCADHRIEATKGLSRALKALHEAYDYEVRQHLDRRHLEVVELACNRFKEEFSYELLVLQCSIANELNHKYVTHGGVSDEDVRVFSLCALMVLRALQDIPDMVVPQKLAALDDEILEAYIAPYELDLSQNIKTCKIILTRCLSKIDLLEVEQ